MSGVAFIEISQRDMDWSPGRWWELLEESQLPSISREKPEVAVGIALFNPAKLHLRLPENTVSPLNAKLGCVRALCTAV